MLNVGLRVWFTSMLPLLMLPLIDESSVFSLDLDCWDVCSLRDEQLFLVFNSSTSTEIRAFSDRGRMTLHGSNETLSNQDLLYAIREASCFSKRSCRCPSQKDTWTYISAVIDRLVEEHHRLKLIAIPDHGKHDETYSGTDCQCKGIIHNDIVRAHLIFVVDSDFGLFPPQQTNFDKDLIKLLDNAIPDVAMSVIIRQRHLRIPEALSGLSMIGSPNASDMYRDLSHFNKAFTLKKLIHSSHSALSNSMQAHLLSQVEVSLIVSKGIRFQVIIFEDLLSPDAELFRVFSNPILTVPFKEKHIPFQRRFSDEELRKEFSTMPFFQATHAVASMTYEELASTGISLAAALIQRKSPVKIPNVRGHPAFSKWKWSSNVTEFLSELKEWCPRQNFEGKHSHPDKNVRVAKDLKCEVDGHEIVRFLDVKVSDHGRHYDPDNRAAMSSLPTLNYSTGFQTKNLTMTQIKFLLSKSSISTTVCSNVSSDAGAAVSCLCPSKNLFPIALNSLHSNDCDGQSGFKSYQTLPTCQNSFQSSVSDNDNKFMKMDGSKSNFGANVMLNPICDDHIKDSESDHKKSRAVFFTSLPREFISNKMGSTRSLFLTEEDFNLHRQFAWVSTYGSTTHAHFDQDYNLFIQVVGRKRFILFPPCETPYLAAYPRLHPLWHKSQVDFCNPNLSAFPEFALAKGQVVDLEPGDLLYIPPYYWHHVQTLSTPSLSLSTLSHDESTRNAMEAIYRLKHKFDFLASARGKMFALRLYLDMMIHELIGNHPNETQLFFSNLVYVRYWGLEHHFADKKSICDANIKGQIPTAQHVYGDCNADRVLVASHFSELEPEVRDLLFLEYVEELSAEVVGTRNVLSFFKYCFRGQPYYLTNLGDTEHLLWEYVSDEDEVEVEDEYRYEAENE